jgi:hypothetical protein
LLTEIFRADLFVLSERLQCLISTYDQRGTFLRKKDILEKKKLAPDANPLDYMSSEELGANLFRATQTEAKLKRE